MTKVEVELLTDQTNNAVLRLPERKFPGVLVQGDTLHSLVEAAEEVAGALREEDLAEAARQLQDLTERLGEITTRYEDAMRQHAISLPY